MGFPTDQMTGRTQIKICGVMDFATAHACAELNVDAIGLMRFAGSVRFIDDQRAADIATAIPASMTVVSVYRNHSVDHIANTCIGSCVQLHGDETAKFVDALRATLPPDITIIRALAFDADEVVRWNEHPAVDALLIEGAAPGEGCGFDHTALAPLMARLHKPVILAGGLTPDTVGEAVAALRPAAVDVSSGVEKTRGVKDVGLIKAFCDAVRDVCASPMTDDAHTT